MMRVFEGTRPGGHFASGTRLLFVTPTHRQAVYRYETGGRVTYKFRPRVNDHLQPMAFRQWPRLDQNVREGQYRELTVDRARIIMEFELNMDTAICDDQLVTLFDKTFEAMEEDREG